MSLFCSQNRVSVALWDKYAEQVQNFMNSYKEGPIVIAIQFCRINSFNGKNSITNSMYSTRVIINDPHPTFEEFLATFLPEQIGGSDSRILLSPNHFASAHDDGGFGDVVVSIIDLYEKEDKSEHCIVAEILKVDTDGGWWYESCTRCAKKVIRDGRGYSCDKCNVLYPTCRIR